MLANFELTMSDKRQISDYMMKQLEPKISEILDKGDFMLAVNKKVDKAINEHFDNLREGIKNIAMEEIKIQLKGVLKNGKQI